MKCVRKSAFVVLFIGIWFGGVAQNHSYWSVGKTMRQIPDSSTLSVKGIADYINARFSNQNNKSLAIFIWIAKNIAYDIDKMYDVYTYQNQTEVAEKTLKIKKGVCFDYAALFNEIAQKVGIKSYLILGYTKQNGVVDILPHAWCAALIDSKWYLFDPTWGSGTLQNSSYVKQFNSSYYKTKPDNNILSHMPFDPLWQLLDHPISNSVFYGIKLENDSHQSYFNLKDTLAVYEKQSDLERLIATNKRIEKTELLNSLITDRLEYNRKEIIYYKNLYFESQLNSAIGSYNNANKLLNQFIEYYNNKFIPIKNDSEIQKMIDTVETCLDYTRKKVINISIPDAHASLLIKQLNDSIDKDVLLLNEKKKFLKKYFNTGQQYREYLFYNWKSQ